MRYISSNPWIPHSKYINFPILFCKNQIWYKLKSFTLIWKALNFRMVTMTALLFLAAQKLGLLTKLGSLVYTLATFLSFSLDIYITAVFGLFINGGTTYELWFLFLEKNIPQNVFISFKIISLMSFHISFVNCCCIILETHQEL